METWSRAAARELLEQARTRHALGTAALTERGAAPERVRAAYRAVRDARVLAQLAEVPVDRIREVSTGRVRVGPVEAAGFRTVAQVLGATTQELDAISGVGPKTARLLREAARQIFDAVDEALTFRIEADPDDPLAGDLVRALHTHEQVARFFDAWGERADVDVPELARLAEVGALRTTLVRRLFAGRERTAAADTALTGLRETVAGLDASGVTDALRRLDRTLTGTSDAEVWRDYEARAAAYYTALGELVDLGVDVEAAEGYLPEEVVDQVTAQDLDTSLLTVSLRGYQAFGARYALVQRRTILGDEMGLGKTVQAIAAMAHLAARGRRHFLVVCPASVATNWAREVAAHSRLPVRVLHSDDRDAGIRTWVADGGVGIVTFPQLGHLRAEGLPRPALLVVDEAHYVKNPRAQRSERTAGWARAAERVLFMSGTPMENTVDEFRNLVHYLKPDVAASIDPAAGLAGAAAFRRSVASVYLRRNQEDVLTELPELVQVDEWERFGKHDGAAYRRAVLKRSFADMRRAAFVQAPEPTAKLVRLREIVAEAMDNNRKVVVFSFFRDVIETVLAELGHLAIGPITGSVPARRRQELVDEFTRAPEPKVLVSQIEAGGVGLNIQAASVVILCEPQVKPTVEAQAIARAHRMGQVRTVQVHRLLVENSVDERLLEILGTKAELFAEYAGRSTVAVAPGATDVADAELARRIVEEERARLAEQAA
ncbi:Helicase conserved C-terminal domain-containing protein [Promicromonospora umidemergens]|uniref:DEAD/DEAH box helicase n=1 Tax=Promicromonospora umidemergens TaxID=629679 RepID=A0ABP8XFE8_9MICO|nr:SNF2-related protein [Promicromonospora umidemergens]MCP2282957.1 Helicase conserved C-terminal domain-containing protein [Promicromonospora umidemergens]